MTKSHDIPKVCPKCHRVTWNDDYVPDAEVKPADVPAVDPNFDYGA